jgi:hypothetical protein
MVDRPGRESEQLAFTDLVSNELLIQRAEENRGIVYIYLYAVFLPNLRIFLIELVRGLVKTSNSPVFLSCCLARYPRRPISSSLFMTQRRDNPLVISVRSTLTKMNQQSVNSSL